MKKYLFIPMLCFSALAAHSQSTAGLIAHWDFNGTTNDVTGNGHNGSGSGVVDSVGITGTSHTAYYFDGNTSVVTAPYLPDLNLAQYSICAVVKPTGYYQGTCLTNTIFTRGIVGMAAGEYSLFFTNVINECTTTDTTSEVFGALAGPNDFIGHINVLDYSPHIVKNNWYKVVATYDGSHYHVYVNGVLMTNVVGDGMPIGTSTQGISVGKSVYDPAGYPYFFKGFIDDVRLYDRVLADTEVAHYGDNCGAITTEPVASHTPIGGTSVFTVSSSIVSPMYQWQQDAGTGYVNLSNAGPYSGVTTGTLTIANVTPALNADHYRCVVSNTAGCADTSAAAILTAGIGNIISTDMVHVFPNPANDHISIELPFSSLSGSSARIQLMSEVGQVISDRVTTENVTMTDLTGLVPGVYLIKITVGSQNIYKKVLKG